MSFEFWVRHFATGSLNALFPKVKKFKSLFRFNCDQQSTVGSLGVKPVLYGSAIVLQGVVKGTGAAHGPGVPLQTERTYML